MRILREEAIALVIDYQEKLVPVMDEKELLIDRSQILLRGLKILDVQMIITQQYTKGLGTTVRDITLAVEKENYVEKISFSAYENVKEMIQAKKFVIVCGIESHICVLQTVIDLAAAGYIPVVVEDCISSRNKRDKKTALERMIKEGAIITTSESLLFELLREAGTETSKKIQRLIK
jgi:isochorismate hydrolase